MGTKFDKRDNSSGIRVSEVGDPGRYRHYMETEIKKHPIKLQVYTASDISIIPEETWEKMGSLKLQGTKVKAQNASGKRMKFKG